MIRALTDCGARFEWSATSPKPPSYNRRTLVQDAPPQVSSWALYRRLLGYVRPYWRIFALSVVGMIVVALADYTMATLVGPLIQNFEKPAPGMMIRLPLMIAGVFLLRGAGTFISDYGMGWVGHRVVFELRGAMARHLLRLPTRYYDDSSAGISGTPSRLRETGKAWEPGPFCRHSLQSCTWECPARSPALRPPEATRNI